MFHSNPLSLGHRDITHPSSSNVIYDEQPLFPPASHPASVCEDPRVPGAEEAFTRAQICEKAEEFKDMGPEKKSTLNPSEMKHQPLLQKNGSKRDPLISHSDKKHLLKVENGVAQRGRSASPKKSASRYTEEHLEKTPSPLKQDPRRRPRERSPSPRKGETTSRPGSGQGHASRGRGRSSSPKKQQRAEGPQDQPSAEARAPEVGGRRAGGRAPEGAEQTSDGRERAGVGRRDTKQRPRSPEEKSKRMDEKSPASNFMNKVGPEAEKGKRAPLGETSRERAAPNTLEDDRGRGEAADRNRERGSPARRPPITPGPWKVPSASRAPGVTGAAEKRL